jgi:hypothetical protein
MKREHEPEVVACAICDGTGVVKESILIELADLQQEWCRLVDAIYGAGPIPVGEKLTCGMAVERADGLHEEIGILTAQLQLNRNVVTAMRTWIEYQRSCSSTPAVDWRANYIRTTELWAIVTRSLAVLSAVDEVPL